jgi:cation:H+ antiporter
VVLVTIFGLYVRRVLRAERTEEPELIGPAKLLGALQTKPRRFSVVALFMVAAAVIFLVAEPFAESLIEAGVALGLPKRTLVQWLAPLASEAPEFIITGLFAWRLLGTASLGTLVSSKVNQWTLLVSTIPLVFNIATWRLGKAVPAVLPLDAFQREDLLLTSAQSLFAVALLLDLRLSWKNAASLLGLFLFQLFLPDTHRWVTVIYLVLSAFFLIRHFPHIRAIVRVLLGKVYEEPPARHG